MGGFAIDGPRTAGWREGSERQRRRFEFDFRDRDDDRGFRRNRGGSNNEDDSLPEWCLDEDGEGETGTFDSSGAYMSVKVLIIIC